MRESLRELVTETLAFVRQEWDLPASTSPPAPKPKAPSPPAIPQRRAVKLPPKPAPKAEPLPPPPTRAPRSLDGMKSLLKQVAPTLELIQPTAPIVLLLSDEEKAFRPFLENVASAISRAFLPAQVITERPPVGSKLVLATAKGKSPHELIKRSGKPPLLVLAPLQSYQDDQENKRALWETLKQLLPSL